MKKKEAFYTNDFFLLDEDDSIIGVECSGRRAMLGDKVRIKDDGCGYIAPGITEAGYGKIVDLTDDYTDHYFGVAMENGEYAHLKQARIAEVFPKITIPT